MKIIMEHYLDNAATTRPCKEAVTAMTDVLENFYGNPSSTHTLGRMAKEKLEAFRKNVADSLFAKPDEIVFTSCGSEGDNFALLMGADYGKRKGKHIISSAAEHDAVRKTLDKLETLGFEVTKLKPDKTGAVSASDVVAAIRDDTILISLMSVNNETGAVTDIKEISKLAKQKNPDILIHSDCVQAFKKIPVNVKNFGADMITVSGHKIHSVKGVGALYIRSGIKIKPLISGGEQERGLRAGTESLHQIASFAAACSLDSKSDEILKLKEYLTAELIKNIPELKYIDTPAPHILNISMPGWRSEVLMNFLEAKEIYVSKSSACKQGKRSHVLEAMGLDNGYIDGALRIGLSRYNTKEDIDAFVFELKNARKLAHR